jgi:hypothetical protein
MSSRLAGPLVAAMIAPLAHAGELAGPCGSAVSALNEGNAWEAFDKLNGGGDKRLRFRLDGKEPCDAVSDCRVSIVAKAVTAGKAAPQERRAIADGTATADKTVIAALSVATLPGVSALSAVAVLSDLMALSATPGKAAAGKVIATVSLAGRTASYCVYGMNRVSGSPAPRRDGCSGAWLENFLTIKLVDGDGPFARRDISIRYLYRADAGAGNLDACTSPAILDGMFRRRLWTVALDDGSAAFIGEIDFPRDRRTPVPQDAPFAASVAAAR